MTRKSRFVAAWIATVLAAALALVLHLTVRFETIRLGYSVGELRSEHRKLLETKRLLSLEKATLRHIPRVKRFAVHALSMRPPRAEQVVSMPADEGTAAP